MRPLIAALGHHDWLSSSLAHEMVHVAELKRHPQGGHCLWGKDKPLNTALKEITGRDETAEPEAGFCP